MLRGGEECGEETHEQASQDLSFDKFANDINEQGLRFGTTMKPNTLNIKVPANSLACAVKHEAGVQKIFAFAENI